MLVETFNMAVLSLKLVESIVSPRVLFVTLFVICMSLFWFTRRSQSWRYPPGPWGFPVIGHVPLLGKNPALKFSQYRKRFGDVYSLRFGSYPVVVLNGTETIKTALTRRPDDFGGRPLLYSFKVISEKQNGNTGLSIPFGPRWKVLRKIANNALRMFANHRTNPIEEILHEEGNRLVEFFLSQEKTAFNPRDEIFLSIGSVIYQILFGRNTNIREDKLYCDMIKASRDFVEFASVGNPVDIIPWTRFFFQSRMKKFLDIIDIPYKVLKTQSELHEQTYDYDSTRDVMDALLNAAEDISREETDGMNISKDLVKSLTVDFLGAGFDTVGTSVLWAILLMAIYPDVQEQVHKEIDDKIGRSRRPTMDDKKRLVFVEATVLEIMRFSSVVPLSVPRETTVDVEVGDYIIPEKTFIMVNQYSTCMDQEVFGDPEKFRPDRFLTKDEKGELSIDTNLAESFMVFGAGRRRCIGEFLAKVELFLLFTMIMQRCSFAKSDSEQYSEERVFGLTVKPAPYKIVASERA